MGKCTAVAATALMIACAAATAAPAHADDTLDLRRAAAPALAPGVEIGLYNSDSTPADNCTAGWLVHDAGGQAGLLTAGHCYHGGGAIFNDTETGFQPIGRFTEHVDEGNKGEDADIALVGVTFPVDTDTRVIGIRPVDTPADPARLAVGQQLCKYGAATKLQCGSIIEVTATKVRFAAPAAVGDSGGPVYYRNANGTATPVGIAIGISDSDGGTVAELIGPWLQRWQLTVDTTPAAAPASAGYHPR